MDHDGDGQQGGAEAEDRADVDVALFVSDFDVVAEACGVGSMLLGRG
jgi:hypothetical protein